MTSTDSNRPHPVTDRMAYQFGWTFKVVFPPDANDEPDFEFNPDWVKVERSFFHPIRNWRTWTRRSPQIASAWCVSQYRNRSG